MQEIIHAFGIDWRLIVIQMFNFAILAGALWYFLYTPILTMLREREDRVRQGVQDAEAAAAARAEANTDRARILTEAEHTASHMVKRASQHAEEKAAGIIAEAETRAQRIVADSQEKAVEIEHQAFKSSEAEIARVAVLAAEKLIRSELTK